MKDFFGAGVKICPYCGEEGRIRVWSDKYGFLASDVVCTGCGMSTKTFHRSRGADNSDFDFISKALGTWNARVS